MNKKIESLQLDDINALLSGKDFPESVLKSEERVVVVLTQGWCPQWIAMKMWLSSFCDRAKIYVLVYDRHELFDKIRTYKEQKFENYEIPYLRFYHNGKLEKETNYISSAQFESFIR